MENKTPKEVAIEFANQKFTSIQDCIAAAKLLMNEYDLSAKGRIVNEAVRFGCYAYWELVIEELGNYRRYMESRSAEYELLPGIVYDDKNDPPPQQPSTTPTEAPTNPFQCYQHKTWGKTYCSAQCDYCKNSYAPSTEQENHHRCVKLPGGAIAIVSPNTSPELLDALDRMVELARKMPDASIEQVGEKDDIHFTKTDDELRKNYEVEEHENLVGELQRQISDLQNHLSRYQKSAGDMKFMVESDPVNWVLANALRLLTPEQMIYLSDALYERSPHPQGRWSDRVKSLESQLKASKEEAGEYRVYLKSLEYSFAVSGVTDTAKEIGQLIAKYPSPSK